MTAFLDFTVLTIATLGPVLVPLLAWRAVAWFTSRRQS